MTMITADISKRLKASATPIVCFLIIAYFSYHMVQGDRGLFSYLKLSHEIEKADSALLITESEKAILVSDGDRQAWIPKSQVEYEEIENPIKDKMNPDAHLEYIRIEIPEWLAKDKRLI